MMKLKLTIVQFADISGTGFDRQPDLSPPADRSFWEAAQKLLARDVRQPSELIKHTLGIPVCGLRQTSVGQEKMWCFSVQGRGRRFVPAWTCRFGFPPITTNPA